MGGGRGATVQRAGKGPTAQIGSTRHGVERTSNMLCMVVTLEVLKLSGWLNADAPCQESRKEGHTVQGQVYGSAGGRLRRWTTAVQAACRREGTRLAADWGQGTGRSAH